jgi:hypothetical protein
MRRNTLRTALERTVTTRIISPKPRVSARAAPAAARSERPQLFRAITRTGLTNWRRQNPTAMATVAPRARVGRGRPIVAEPASLLLRRPPSAAIHGEERQGPKRTNPIVHRLPRAAGRVPRPAAQDSVERVAPPAHRRPVDLVWRGTGRIDRAAAGGSRAAASPPSPPARAAVQESTSVEPTRTAKAAALKLTDLDPGLVERLTDDVIRRVDRRVRIERERRGL